MKRLIVLALVLFAGAPAPHPNSLQAVPSLDRVVSASADMMPSVRSSHVVQVWRLEDGITVLVSTANCALYRLEGLASTDPTAQFVHNFGYRACAVPIVVGRYWVQPTMSGHSITSLDVSDPSRWKPGISH